MAAGPTYVSIASQTLSTAASSVTFSSISGAYTDLILVAVPAQGAPVGSSPLVQVGNGSVDTGANYSYTRIVGTGSAATSLRDTNLTYMPDSYGGITATLGESQIIYHFMNYANTSTYKPVLMRSGYTAGSYAGVTAYVHLWRSTSAINTIKFFVSGTAMSIGTSLTLYGIAAA